MGRDFLGIESLYRLLELIKTELSNYVKSEKGKGLSTEDFTTELRNEVTSIKKKVDKNTTSWSRDIVYGQGKRNGAEMVMMVGEDPTASGVIPRFVKSTKDGKTSIVLRTNEPVNDTDCVNKKYVDDIVGNIENSLDNIIAIQNELISSPQIIKFAVNGIEYEAIEGMIWAEWCESEYNTINAQNQTYYIYCPIDIGGYIRDAGTQAEVLPTDKIIPNCEYTCF